MDKNSSELATGKKSMYMREIKNIIMHFLSFLSSPLVSTDR